jgi:endonuclease YncB( thermonuclease family)
MPFFIGDQDINLLSIKGGFFWHYKQYSKDQEYANAEDYAKYNKPGLWKLADPLPLWSWRQKQ